MSKAVFGEPNAHEVSRISFSWQQGDNFRCLWLSMKGEDSSGLPLECRIFGTRKLTAESICAAMRKFLVEHEKPYGQGLAVPVVTQVDIAAGIGAPIEGQLVTDAEYEYAEGKE